MKIGLFASAFDPFPHVGHLWAMRQAIDAGACQLIWAAIHIDPSIERPGKRRPATPLVERRAMVEAIRYVESTVEYATEADLLAIVAAGRPDVLIVGDDHRGDRVTGSELGIPIFYARRRPEWSGTAILERLRCLPAS